MIDVICEKLKNNFLFQSSLGSKELFHSNMLAWILEQKNTNGEYMVLKTFAKDIAGIETNDIKEPAFSREEYNLDLILKWTDEGNMNYIFIENKMKSIPSANQLEEYDIKISRFTKKENNTVKKLLLTPFPNTAVFENNISTTVDTTINWENISYSANILPFLHKIALYDFANEDVPFVVEKYISFLENQHQLLVHFCLDRFSDSFNNRKYDFYVAHALDNVRRLRLHDLILKLAHFRIETLLRVSLKNENIEVYRFETAFTNSTGISSVDIKISEKHHFFIGIQMQGNQFRYYVQTNKSEDIKSNERLSVELFNQKLWFYDIDNQKPLKGKGNRKEYYKNLGLKDDDGPRAFCEYNKGGFVYLYKELNTGNEMPTIKDIVDLFVRSLKHFHQNRPQILQILEKLY